MKWKAPINGEERIFERFAWWPEKIGSTYVWLERYSVAQRYHYEWINFQVSLDGTNWFPKRTFGY